MLQTVNHPKGQISQMQLNTVSKLAKKERDMMREAIFADYPKLRQMPECVDMLIDNYGADPEKFKEQAKALERKEMKANRKKKTAVEAQEPAEYDPSKFIIPDGITRIPAEESAEVLKRLSPNIIEHSNETHES